MPGQHDKVSCRPSPGNKSITAEERQEGKERAFPNIDAGRDCRLQGRPGNAEDEHNRKRSWLTAQIGVADYPIGKKEEELF